MTVAARYRAEHSTVVDPRTRGRKAAEPALGDPAVRPAPRRKALTLLPNVLYRGMVRTLLG